MTRDEMIQQANKTARSAGAVGANAVVPRIVASVAGSSQTILDYGAGPKAIHTKALRALGFNVTAYEFGDNCIDGVHDPYALDRKYDIVFASNVMNVQGSKEMAVATLQELKHAVAPLGSIILNFPKSPRYLLMTSSMFRRMLEEEFGRVTELKTDVYYLRLTNVQGDAIK